MGLGNNVDKTGGEMPLQPPPAYQEKEPIDPVVIVEKHDTPIVLQQPVSQCKRKHGKCCCLCCCLLVVFIICATIIPIVIVKMTHRWWGEPDASIALIHNGPYNVGDEAVIRCSIDAHSDYVPLVQWFHDANDPTDGEESGFRLFAVHDIIQDEEYKRKFEIILVTGDHKHVTYELKIKDLDMSHAGRYACQVAKIDKGILDNTFDMDSSSSSSSSDEDHHRRHHHRRCRRNDYVYLDIQQ